MVGSSRGEPKPYAAFLSHYKVETGTESRLVMGELGRLLPPGNNKCFLDSDDLKNLRDLADHVWNFHRSAEARGIMRSAISQPPFLFLKKKTSVGCLPCLFLRAVYVCCLRCETRHAWCSRSRRAC